MNVYEGQQTAVPAWSQKKQKQTFTYLWLIDSQHLWKSDTNGAITNQILRKLYYVIKDFPTKS